MGHFKLHISQETSKTVNKLKGDTRQRLRPDFQKAKSTHEIQQPNPKIAIFRISHDKNVAKMYKTETGVLLKTSSSEKRSVIM